MTATEPRPLRSHDPSSPPPPPPDEGELLLRELLDEALEASQQSVLVQTDLYTLAAVAGYALTARPWDPKHPVATFSRGLVQQLQAAGFPHMATLAAGQKGWEDAPQSLKDALHARMQREGISPDAPLPEC